VKINPGKVVPQRLFSIKPFSSVKTQSTGIENNVVEIRINCVQQASLNFSLPTEDTNLSKIGLVPLNGRF
jgi:hypothetical protein